MLFVAESITPVATTQLDLCKAPLHLYDRRANKGACARVFLISTGAEEHLDEPDDVVGVELILHDPGGQDVPLDALAAVDGDAVLGVLVLGSFQVAQHLLRQLRQEAAVQQVVLRKSPVLIQLLLLHDTKLILLFQVVLRR